MYDILPIDDLKEHEEKSTCPCGPRVEVVEGGNMVCIHNSYDGREAVEWANEIFKSGKSLFFRA